MLSEIEDDISGLPELLTHTHSQGHHHHQSILDKEDPLILGSTGSPQDDDPEEEDAREGDSDTTVEVNSLATAQTHPTELDPGSRPSAKPGKGKHI